MERKERPDREVLKLSDSFIHPIRDGEYEWSATALNINYWHNAELLASCETLNQYSEFIYEIRNQQKECEDTEQAVARAIHKVRRDKENYQEENMKKITSLMVSALLTSCIVFGCPASDVNASDANESEVCASKDVATEQQEERVRIGVAWRADTDSEFYTNICKAVEAAGGETVLLDEVVDYDLSYTDIAIASEGITENDYLTEAYAEIIKENTYTNSNIQEIMEAADVDAVIFTGGEDISPSLTAVSTDWHHIEEEKDYNAARDVSDYLLMTYCIDKDIPVMGFCRGMQMLAVVSGGTMIQDIPTFYEEQGLTYQYEHRNQKETPDSYRDYAAHDISILSKDSIIYDIFACDTVENVPSWHHQAVLSVENTPLAVTAETETDGYSIIEAIERTDKSLIMGFQFHPEAAIVKNLEHADNAGDYMDYDTAIRVFQYLINYVNSTEVDLAA